MNYELAGTVLDWITEPAGECDRPKLFKWLNQARERFYQMYPDIPLFFITECFEVQTFCTDCNECNDMFAGITLPRDHQTVEAMWFQDTPLNLYSEWREWQRGISPQCSCELSKIDLPGSFSSERDVYPKRPARLQVRALHPNDVGKKAVLRYVDITGTVRMTEFPLSLTGGLTELPVKGLAPGAGFSKDRTEGAVLLAEDNGRLLSLYAPDETVPTYRRIKLLGLRAGCDKVNIKSARKFFPLFRENDVVETDNRTAFEEMARFLRLNSKNEKDGNDLKAAGYHLGQARLALAGDKARQLGKSTQTEVQVVTPNFSRRALGGWARFGH